MNREPFALDEYYHIYNRGVDKRIVFNNDYDYERLKLLLYVANSDKPIRPAQLMQDGKEFYDLWKTERGKQLVSIGAWCLMPNHFHLLVREISQDGISKFMQKLGTAYTMFFNFTNKRTGALFQGRYKSKHVTEDKYLRYLYSYIHMNPLKLKDSQWKERDMSKKLNEDLVMFLKDFSHSSFPDYLGSKRKEQIILSKDDFPGYFEKVSHVDDIKEWLSYNHNHTG